MPNDSTSSTATPLQWDKSHSTFKRLLQSYEKSSSESTLKLAVQHYLHHPRAVQYFWKDPTLHADIALPTKEAFYIHAIERLLAQEDMVAPHMITRLTHYMKEHISEDTKNRMLEQSFQQQLSKRKLGDQLLSPDYFTSDESLGEGATKGSTAQVYTRQKKSDGKIVAVKKLVSTAYKVEAAEEAYKLTLTQKCEHIIRLFGIYLNAANELFLVLEYAEQGDLFEIMRRNNKAFSANELLKIMHESLKALQFLHNKQLVHGDISIQNIVVTKAGTVKLADLSSMRSSKDSARLRYAALRYSALEVLLMDVWWDNSAYQAYLKFTGKTQETLPFNNAYGPSPASDIYSFALTILHAAQKLKPFGEQYPSEDSFKIEEVTQAMMRGSSPYTTINDVVPARALLLNCMSHIPENRPTAEKLLKATENDYKKIPSNTLACKAT